MTTWEHPPGDFLPERDDGPIFAEPVESLEVDWEPSWRDVLWHPDGEVLLVVDRSNPCGYRP